MTFTGPLAYGAVFTAAVVEGEAMFVAASVLVATGRLHPLGVLVAGALGAATGDQIYFYLFRGRVDRWLARLRLIAARHEVIVARVRRYESLMIFGIRFAPGLRIAITAACAYAGVRALRFSVINVVSAFVWAAVLLELVTRLGPAVLARLGISGIWGAIVPGALIVLFAWWISRAPASADPALQ